MSVDDYGIEALKKSAEEETLGSKAEYRLKTRVVSSALPTGASTSDNQTNGLQKTQIVDAGDGSPLDLVKEGENYNNAMHGIIPFGVDDSSPNRKTVPFKTDNEGHQYNHLIDTANNTIDPATSQNQSALQEKFFSNTSTTTNVSASVTSVTLLSANSSRKGVALYNDSNSSCFVKFGTTASSSSFTIKMDSNSFLSLQFPIYLGRIDAIWSVANGSMRVTELT